MRWAKSSLVGQQLLRSQLALVVQVWLQKKLVLVAVPVVATMQLVARGSRSPNRLIPVVLQAVPSGIGFPFQGQSFLHEGVDPEVGVLHMLVEGSHTIAGRHC